MSRTYIIEMDGYHIAERLLEGLVFTVTVEVFSLDEIYVKDISWPSIHNDYFSNFNQEKYLMEIKHRFQDDIWSTYENITEEEAEDFVAVFGDPSFSGPPGIKINMSGDEFIEEVKQKLNVVRDTGEVF